MIEVPKPQPRVIDYAPAGPVVKAFHESEAFVRGIRGPVGSGKSTACVLEILRRSAEQAPSPIDGVARTRWAIIRNSFPELKTTTLKTWNEWCPTEMGKLTMDSPIVHRVQTKQMDMEIFFMALDRPEDVKKLLSLELTGAWINEAKEVPKAILDALTGRVGRYPSKKHGGATWRGIIMDTNPPDDQSWWYDLAEVTKPRNYYFFSQPSGRSKEAENRKNLPHDYYENLIPGKDEDWVKVFVDGEYGYLIEGKVVYPMFRDRIHVSQIPIEVIANLPIYVGADFGLTPAAIFGQHMANGRWVIIDELVMDNHGTIRFAKRIMDFVAVKYPYHSIILPKNYLGEGEEAFLGTGDPAGNERGQNDERTALEIMRERTGWKWKPAPTNVMLLRREAVVNCLDRLIDGEPGLLISPSCPTLRKGFTSGYHYKFIRSSNGAVTHEYPDKNKYSHPHDALQYLLLGGGEANIVLNREARKKRRSTSEPRFANNAYKIFS